MERSRRFCEEASVDTISRTLDGRKYLVQDAARFIMASPQHQREVSAGRQSVRSGAFLAHVVISNTNSLRTLGAVQIDPSRQHSAVNRQQPTGIGLVIFYPFAYRGTCTTEHFFTAIQARKKVPNSGIDRLHNYDSGKTSP